jgi:hypothetical protein
VEIDVMADAAEGDLGAVVSKSFLGDATTGPRLFQQRDRSRLDEPCADTPENVLAGLTLYGDIVDVVPVQELAEQQSCRTGTYDCDLRALSRFHSSGLE